MCGGKFALFRTQKNTSKTRDGDKKRKSSAPRAQNETKQRAEVHKTSKQFEKVTKLSSKARGTLL